MDLKTLIKLAKAQGWTVGRNSKGHPTFWAPGADLSGRPTVTGAGTASDYRSNKNTVADLRKAGLQIPHKGHTVPKNKRK